MKKNKRFAFTLAEVLITLGIIGVVAALTVPTLLSNYQTRAWDTAAEVFEKKLEQSLRVMNSQSKLAGHKTTENWGNVELEQMYSEYLDIRPTYSTGNITRGYRLHATEQGVCKIN